MKMAVPRVSAVFARQLRKNNSSEKIAHLILLKRADLCLWGDITSTENRVPPPCHLHVTLLGYPPPSPSGMTSFMDGP